MFVIRCRLNDLLREKNIQPEALAEATGIPLLRIDQYRENALNFADLGEAALILSKLDCAALSDLFSLETLPDGEVAPTALPESTGVTDDWDSHCPCSADGRHAWYRDDTVSNSVYQEFVCASCGIQFHVIW